MSTSIDSWSVKVRALQQSGMSLPEIGDICGLSGSAVGDLATGRSVEPKGMSAVKLHSLFLERCGETLDENKTTTDG